MNQVGSFFLRVLLTGIGIAVTFLPRFLELKIAKVLGRFLFLIGRKRKVVAQTNIQHCFPEKSNAWRQSVLRANFEHYGLLMCELFHLFSPFPNHYRRYVSKHSRVEGAEHIRNSVAKGKGVIFVSSHLSNWEFMVGAGGLIDTQLTMVTKHLKPEWLHKKIETQRRSMGVNGAYEPRTLPIVLRALKKGECVGFVMDQYAGPPMGILVNFFGVQVGTLAAVSVLVERTGATVLCVKTYRDETGFVHVCVEPEIDLSKVASDNAACTSLLTAQVERWVREYPEQWYWIHRRFKGVVWPKEVS